MTDWQFVFWALCGTFGVYVGAGVATGLASWWVISAVLFAECLAVGVIELREPQ